jgi:hypothetical protein
MYFYFNYDNCRIKEFRFLNSPIPFPKDKNPSFVDKYFFLSRDKFRDRNSRFYNLEI